MFNPRSITPFYENSNKIKARTIIEGYGAIGCDAMNIGTHDLAYGMEFLQGINNTRNLPLISGNIYYSDSNDPVFDTYKLIKRNNLDIAVTGVTFSLPSAVSSLELRDPISVGTELIAELNKKADIVVILVDAAQQHHKTIKREFIGADYIFTSNYTMRTPTNLPQPDNGPIFYSLGKEGRYLAVIEADIVDSKAVVTDITNATEQISMIEKRLMSLQKKDPEKSLEELYAESPNILRVINNYEEKRGKAEQTLATAVNRSTYKSVPMDKEVDDDPELLELVEASLAECEQLKKSRGSGASNRSRKVVPKN